MQHLAQRLALRSPAGWRGVRLRRAACARHRAPGARRNARPRRATPRPPPCATACCAASTAAASAARSGPPLACRFDAAQIRLAPRRSRVRAATAARSARAQRRRAHCGARSGRRARRSIRRKPFRMRQERHPLRATRWPHSLRRLSPASSSRRKAAASLVSRSSALSESVASWRSRAMSSLNCTSRCSSSAMRSLARVSSRSSVSRATTSRCKAAPARPRLRASGGSAGGGGLLRFRGFGLRQRRGRDLAHAEVARALGLVELRYWRSASADGTASLPACAPAPTRCDSAPPAAPAA